MLEDKTSIFNVGMLRQELIMMTLGEVISSMERNGYNSTNQLIGYLTTADLSYITTFENARRKLGKFTREEVLKAIINGYLGK